MKTAGKADTVEAARIMTRRHLSPRTAHGVVTQLVRNGIAWVNIPQVEDLDQLLGELAASGVNARLHEPSSIDPKRVRDKTGLSEDDFAVRYGLDVDTLRLWESGAIEPDAAARTVLWTIALHPEAIEASLEGNAESHIRETFGA